MKTLFDTLEQRGFIAACTDKNMSTRVAGEALTVYSGFDPTASSLHVGNLAIIMMLAHFQRAGHKVIALVGGGTASIGDPSGRASERKLLSEEEVAANSVGVEVQLRKFLQFDGDNPANCINNLDWWSGALLLKFLRDIGKHFPVTAMLAKDSVKSRLGNELSFTEFTYQCMQATDFLHLFDNHGCTLQIGGSDQWGNITAGIELIRRKRQQPAFGITCPLLTTADGEKFGKSAGNAIWLEPERTTPWEFFQFFVRQSDADVLKLLKVFTFLPAEELSRLDESVRNNPAAREAQQALAFEVTALVHGKDVATDMQNAAKVVFKGDLSQLSETTLQTVFARAPSSTLSASELEAGIQLSKLLAQTGLAPSITQARKLITGGGAAINNVKATADVTVNKSHLLHKRHIVLKSGKAMHFVRVV